MKKITEEHFCDYCGVSIDEYAPVRVHAPVRITGHEEETFSYTIGVGGYSYKHHEFCSELCFVLDIAKSFGVELTGYTDSESK